MSTRSGTLADNTRVDYTKEDIDPDMSSLHKSTSLRVTDCNDISSKNR